VTSDNFTLLAILFTDGLKVRKGTVVHHARGVEHHMPAVHCQSVDFRPSPVRKIKETVARMKKFEAESQEDFMLRMMRERLGRIEHGARAQVSSVCVCVCAYLFFAAGKG
jgi:hypothetical protein